MDRNKRTAVVVLVAVLLAAVASLGMYRVVSARPASEGSAVKTVDVVVAQHPLPLGTRLTRDHVKLAKWPADTQVPGAFAKVDEVVDRGLIATVEENEPLTAAKVAPLEAGAGLPPSIPPGMRAVSVKVNEVVGVAGFVVPGTRVDVMVTLTNRQAQQESMTRVVVSNVQVLTAGTRIRPGEREGRQTDSLDRGDPAGVAGRRRADRAGGVRGPNHADAPQSAGYVTDERRRVCGPPGCSDSRPRPRRRGRAPRVRQLRRSRFNLSRPRLRRRRSTPLKPSAGPSEVRRLFDEDVDRMFRIEDRAPVACFWPRC